MEAVRKLNIHFISKVLGLMCLFEVPMGLVCLGLALYYGGSPLPFALMTIAYLIVGGIGYKYGSKKNTISIGRREGMLSVTLTWLILSLLATIPFFMELGNTLSFSSYLFECISGFTTTGATTFVDVEELSHSLLFWRALMQWQGGIGIVVFTVALLPMIGGGASHIYNAETTGITHDRFLPKISDVAQRLAGVYVLETIILSVLLALGPMELFDAISHALTAVSTGGYSTKTAGIAHFDSTYTEYILAASMYIGSLNIALIYFLLLGKPLQLIMDEEFRWFTLIIGAFTIITAFWTLSNGYYTDIEEAFRTALFQCLSLGSSTGFLTANISSWQPFFWAIALLLMFVNGCTGSTSGGMKVARLIVLVKNLRNEFKKQVRPHMLTPVILNGKQIGISVVHQILAFCVLYIILMFVGSMLIMLDGNGFVDSLTIAVAATSNTGPAFGKFASSVEGASDFTKNVLSFLMLAGRLEVFTVIGLLTPYFWRK